MSYSLVSQIQNITEEWECTEVPCCSVSLVITNLLGSTSHNVATDAKRSKGIDISKIKSYETWVKLSAHYIYIYEKWKWIFMESEAWFWVSADRPDLGYCGNMRNKNIEEWGLWQSVLLSVFIQTRKHVQKVWLKVIMSDDIRNILDQSDDSDEGKI